MDFSRDPNYRPLALPHFIGSQRALYDPLPSPDTLHVRMFGHARLPRVRGEVVFGPQCEGPPLHAHGGMIAYVLDEAMGACAWHGGHKVLAQDIRVFFRKLVPLNRPILLAARVTRVVGRTVFVSARLSLEEKGTFLSESRGRFRVIRPDLLKTFQSQSR